MSEQQEIPLLTVADLDEWIADEADANPSSHFQPYPWAREALAQLLGEPVPQRMSKTELLTRLRRARRAASGGVR